MMGLSDGRKSFKIGLVVLIQYCGCDRQPASQPRCRSYRLYAIALSPKSSGTTLQTWSRTKWTYILNTAEMTIWYMRWRELVPAGDLTTLNLPFFYTLKLSHPLPFPSFPSLLFPLLSSSTKRPPENQLGFWRSAVNISVIWNGKSHLAAMDFTIALRKTRSPADADNRLDAFSGQSRSTNMVPFHM